jgi:integrase
LDIPAGRKNGGLTVHSLRHFFKTHCINGGIPKPVVDVWQGHKIDMSVGAQYYKLSDADSQRFVKSVLFEIEASADDADHD